MRPTTSASGGDEPPTDPLTGFGTRQSLLTALTAAVEPDCSPTLLVIFGLEGFDEYVALFGRLAGRTLLVRLAARLEEALSPSGACFRPRYDEFAALVQASIAEAKPVLDAAVVALRERATSVAVTASWGAAMLPEEASDPIGALQIADQRLSANEPRRKRRNRRVGSR